MARSPTLLLLRDELIGFARSRVMLVLWILLPALAIAGYLLLPKELIAVRTGQSMLSASQLIGLILSSIASLIAALMVAVDLVSERNRKVYELFVIRPIRREAIIWAKFLGVFACVSVACVVSMAAGITLDALRGAAITGELLHDVARALLTLVITIAVSCGAGVMIGVMTRSILVAVLLVLYVGQNLAILPMLPSYLGWLPDKLWPTLALSAVLSALLVWGATVMFRRSEI